MPRAMILSAGRGQRMRPLTDNCPKPLLPVAGRPLIEYQIRLLADQGWRELVINLGWQGEQIRHHLGDGHDLGVRIAYSEEGWPALETGGGIGKALPLLGPDPFLVVNGDVYCDVDLSRLALASDDEAALVLVDNPDHHPSGDFALQDGRVALEGDRRLTFTGVGLYHPRFFDNAPAGEWPLAPRLREAIQRGRVAGTHHPGQWLDVGTPERLAALEALLSGQEGQQP